MNKKGFYTKIMLILVLVLIASTFMQTISIAIESINSVNNTLQEEKNNQVEEISQLDNDSEKSLLSNNISETSSAENIEKTELSEAEATLIAEDEKNAAEQIVFNQLEVIKTTNVTNVLRAAASFTLTGEVKLDAANGKGGVYLDWSSYDSTDRTFKAYQIGRASCRERVGH